MQELGQKRHDLGIGQGASLGEQIAVVARGLQAKAEAPPQPAEIRRARAAALARSLDVSIGPDAMALRSST